MISVITPLSSTGNPYIREAYESLCAQTVHTWEWIVLQNKGGAATAPMRSDPRVRLFREEHDGIGRLKRRASGLARNPVIVELDHDDLLAPTALATLLEAVSRGAEFVYSDFAEFLDLGVQIQPNVGYAQDCGWRHVPIEFRGVTLTAMQAPPVTAQNIRLVDWAPNHVRAWTRQAYDRVGGHDPAFTVGDDHDFIVRAFLAGLRFAHIPECLYFYRVHPGNTVRTHNAEIRAATERVYNREIWALGQSFARRHDISMVDLCGAIDTPAGFTPYDRELGHELNDAWPIPDESVGLLRAHDAVEHLRDPIHTMNEAYRVLAPGGFFMIHVPSTNGLGAFCDPTHVSFWNKLSFRYYTDRAFSRYVPGYKGRFQISRIIEWFPSDWHRAENVPYVEAHLFALKPGYEPMGPVTI